MHSIAASGELPGKHAFNTDVQPLSGLTSYAHVYIQQR